MRALNVTVILIAMALSAALPASATAAGKWSITLTASPGTSAPAGSPVVLMAKVNKDVGPTPYSIDILDTTKPKAVTAVCTEVEGTVCRIGLSATGTHSYVAKIESDVNTGVQAASATVKVTWTAAHGWSVTLQASPGTSVATGTGVTLTVTASKSVSPTPYSIDIYDQTDGIQICSAETGTTCVSDPQTLASAGGIVYVAKVEMPDGTSVQATSSTVSVSWGGGVAWSVSLSASPGASVNTGAGVTLKAHASQAVDSTGFVVDIYDSTAGGSPICTVSTGTDCTSPAQSYSSATSHTYVAKVEKSDGTNVQATSSSVQVTWSAAPPPWSVSLSASPSTSVNTGTGVTLTAHANQAVDGTGFVVDIYDTTAGGSPICTASTGTDCVSPSKTYNTQTTHSYIAEVEKSGGTNVQATSSQVQVTWTPPGWSVTLTALPGTTVNTSTSVTLKAHASQAVDGTGYVINIYDTTASPNSKICTISTGTDCTSSNRTYGSPTTRTYVAKVEPSGGGTAKATSSTLTENWADWFFTQPQVSPSSPEALGQPATVSFSTWAYGVSGQAPQPVDNTGFVIHIYDQTTNTPVVTCTTGYTCSYTTPTYSTNATHNYIAYVEHSDKSNQQAQSNQATVKWGTG